MSNHLSGVVFNSKVDGESKPPALQTKLTKEELVRKEKLVFDTALNELKSHWDALTFDSHPIDTKVVLCSEDDLLYDNYDNVKNFLKSPLNKIHKYSDLRKEYMAMFQHCDKHANEIFFRRCNDRSCCGDWRSNGMKEFLKKHDFRLFSPLKNTDSSSYVTFLQQCLTTKRHYGDANQPSVQEKNLGKCHSCPNYYFKSKTEAERHKGMFHRRQNVPSATECSTPGRTVRI